MVLSRWKPCRVAEPPHGPASAILLVALFAAMGLTTRLLCADADGYSSFWPANAAMLVAVLTLRPLLSAPVVLACFVVNLGLNRLSGLSTSEGFLTCVLNVMLVLMVAFPTRRLCGARTDLTRPRRQLAFGLTVLACTAVEAAVGIWVETRFLGDPDAVLGDWLQWVLCDTLGLVLATPAVMLLVGWVRSRRIEPGPVLEPLALMVTIILLTVLSFLSPRSFLFFFLYPAMVTMAFRTRSGWVLSTVLVVSIVVSAFTAHGLGPIALISPGGALMRQTILQPYLWSLFLVALPANNLVGEKRRDVRRLAQMRAHLEHAATHDPLTGLVTRQLFKTRLGNRLRSGAGGTFLFIDLDHFKQVNDTLGHQAGDTLLRMFGDRITRCARPLGGEAARFGGDEFAMYLPRMPNPDALHSVVATVLDAARMPYRIGAATARLSVSIGGASLDGDVLHPDEVIRRADEALYAAKGAGRDDYVLHGDPALTVMRNFATGQ